MAPVREQNSLRGLASCYPKWFTQERINVHLHVYALED